MSRSRPAGKPSRVMTSAWPCDSPALRNRSIEEKLYTKKLHASAGLDRFCRAFPHVVRLASLRCVPHLLRDRYMRLDGDRACDLATGNEVRLDALVEPAEGDGDASLRPVLQALYHGRDGYPRWVVAEARNRRQATATIERVAAAAVRRGFVAISTEVFA